ncbi:MAG: hypothetical protein Fur0046_02290 [Cyanobacteria bacterium J069]
MTKQTNQNGQGAYPARDREPTEAACMAIACLLHAWLEQKTINAQEFLSVIGQLPVSLADILSPERLEP